jgi:hypothetical protein
MKEEVVVIPRAGGESRKFFLFEILSSGFVILCLLGRDESLPYSSLRYALCLYAYLIHSSIIPDEETSYIILSNTTYPIFFIPLPITVYKISPFNDSTI